MAKGSSKLGGKSDEMNVPYDEWGKMLEHRWKDPETTIFDEEGNEVGYIEDEIVYVTEPQIDPIEKKDAINLALDFYSKTDGGWIKDDDYAVYLAYEDGRVRDVKDDPEKGINRRGLVGVYVSTTDDEMSWGGEMQWKNGKKSLRPWGVHNEDGDEIEGNLHFWHKTTGSYKKRTRVTHNNPNGRGGYTTKRETIRKSTVKKFER